MKKIIFTPYEVTISGIEHRLSDKEIYSVDQFQDITVIIFKVFPVLLRYYNNAIGIDNTNGKMIWEIEQDVDLDLQNPYEGVLDHGDYLIFFKTRSHKIAINRKTGKIERDIDLMTGSKPW
ncbi:MAG TPA: hypothetical protein VFG10_20190 [Saprospiraceae bacterium]|nr:hypothetical protein [Saprospiraceae bacterium]